MRYPIRRPIRAAVRNVLSGSTGKNAFRLTVATTGASQTLSFDLSLPTGNEVVIDWGDGNTETVTGPVTSIRYTNIYAAAGEYKLELTGDYSAITKFSRFTVLYLSGNVSEFRKMSALTYLNINGLAGMSGNANAFNSLSNLTLLYFYSTSVDSYSAGTLPAWTNINLQAQNNAWSQASVDALLCDLATAGGTGGSVNVSGTNSYPSSTGLTCKTTLEGQGRTVTVTAQPAAAPVAQSLVISGAGPQIATFVYDVAVTAPTTAELAQGWSVETTTAGVLTLGYSSGDGTDTIVCTIAEDVYDDDTIVAVSYTQGTITESTGVTMLANIADFSTETTNSSTETYSAGCGTSTTAVTDDFSGDLSGWTQEVGTWEINAQTLRPVSSNANYQYVASTTTVDPSCQWVATTVAAIQSTGSIGLHLRANNTDGWKYHVRIKPATDTIVWEVLNGTTLVETVQTIAIPHPVGADRYMAQVSGTGNDTVINVWLNPSGATPSLSGAADYSFTNDPTNPINTGSYVGLNTLWFEGGVITHDNFAAGN